MSTEANKAIARRWAGEVWSQGNLAAIDELAAPNFILHAAPAGVEPDREGYKQFVSMHRTAFPDFHATVEDLVAEGDKVARRLTLGGTHKGEYMGIAPTGKWVTWTGVSILRIAGGKIVEEWAEMDMLGLMEQLGALPPSE